MILAILDGWSSKKKYPIEPLVLHQVRTKIDAFFSSNAKIGHSRSRQLRNFLVDNQSEGHDLFCVGKSLGAKNLIVKVLNKLPGLKYRKISIVTVDPCWPLLFDWRPNLNDQALILQNDKINGINVFFRTSNSSKQAGCKVIGKGVVNYKVLRTDHFAISGCDMTKIAVEKAMKGLR